MASASAGRETGSDGEPPPGDGPGSPGHRRGHPAPGHSQGHRRVSFRCPDLGGRRLSQPREHSGGIRLSLWALAGRAQAVGPFSLRAAQGRERGQYAGGPSDPVCRGGAPPRRPRQDLVACGRPLLPLLTGLASAVVSFLVSRGEYRVAREINSGSLAANASEAFLDVFSSAVVVAGILLSWLRSPTCREP